jgi:hypothetical protein
LIFKNLRAGNVNFFTAVDLSAIVTEIDEYARYVKEFRAIQRRNEQRRFYDLVVANTNPDVQHYITESVGVHMIHSIKLISIVPVSVDTLLERKQLMYRNIALLLAAKAKKIVCNHRGFKSTFRYTAADSTQIEEYFIQRTLAEVDYFELRPTIRAMHTRAIAVQLEKSRRSSYESDMAREEEELENERRYRARRGFEYEDDEHEMGLSQNGYRRAWYGDRQYGYGSDSD